MSEPPPLSQLAFGIVAFVTDEPGGAIGLAARQLRGSFSYVLCISPPATRGAVLTTGARWSNLTAAEEATAEWASRYRHSSSNGLAYERFCLRRWLMLHEAVSRMPDVGPSTALAVLDSDVLLFRHPALWLTQLQAFPQHRDAHATGLFGVAFMILSPQALGRFAAFLRWLYGGSSTRLGLELDRFGVPRPLLELPSRSKRALNRKLLAHANQTSPGHYRHFTDVQAMRGFCTHSNESSLPRDVLPIRCSGIGFGNRCPDAACRGADADVRTRVEEPTQPYHSQPGGSCSTEYLAHAAAGSVVMYTVEVAPWQNIEGGEAERRDGAMREVQVAERPGGAQVAGVKPSRVGEAAAEVGASSSAADASVAVAPGAYGAGTALSFDSAAGSPTADSNARARPEAAGVAAGGASSSFAAGARSRPDVRNRSPVSVNSSPPGPGLLNASMAARWASSLRWSAGHWLVPASTARLHRLCLAHMQGPQAKAGFMEMLAAGQGESRAGAGAGVEQVGGADASSVHEEAERVGAADASAKPLQDEAQHQSASHGARGHREEATHHSHHAHHHSHGHGTGHGTNRGRAGVVEHGRLQQASTRKPSTHTHRAHGHEHAAAAGAAELK